MRLAEAILCYFLISRPSVTTSAAKAPECAQEFVSVKGQKQTIYKILISWRREPDSNHESGSPYPLKSRAHSGCDLAERVLASAVVRHGCTAVHQHPMPAAVKSPCSLGAALQIVFHAPSSEFWRTPTATHDRGISLKNGATQSLSERPSSPRWLPTDRNATSKHPDHTFAVTVSAAVSVLHFRRRSEHH